MLERALLSLQGKRSGGIVFSAVFLTRLLPYGAGSHSIPGA